MDMVRPRGTVKSKKGKTGAFSEVVQHARADGPQRVSVHGQDVVVIVSAEEFDRLASTEPRKPFVEFMESLHLYRLDLPRESDPDRGVEL